MSWVCKIHNYCNLSLTCCHHSPAAAWASPPSSYPPGAASAAHTMEDISLQSAPQPGQSSETQGPLGSQGPRLLWRTETDVLSVLRLHRGEAFPTPPSSQGAALVRALSPSVLWALFLIRGTNRDLARGKHKEDSLCNSSEDKPTLC